MRSPQLNNKRINKMKETHTTKATLTIIDRLKSSVNGNPKYKVELMGLNNAFGIIFETETDAMLGYSISNYDGKLVSAEVRYLKNKNLITKINGEIK
tara:strand:+ start:610 stop:900 length:291 start_codon:yes stop_codon:yes gene_type:complete